MTGGADILIVDDDLDLQDLLSMILERGGYAVETAGNGLEALERLARGLPALILLDMKMPRMGGQEFARHFRKAYDNQVPIVVVTAAADAAARAAEIGADDWLGKPFEIEALLETAGRYARPSR